MAVDRPIVTLTTDFGRSDTFVGEMKGSILSIAPDAAVVDLCHDVPAHDVECGAFLLAAGAAAFPRGTIHVAVVDPGVGTGRAAVAVRTTDAVWVGPDNGVLGRALRGRAILEAHRLDDPAYRRPTRATTFEGRDRFAPAAAWIARGTPLRRFGPAVDGPRIAPSAPVPRPGQPADVPVVHVDRFGNVYLDVARDDVDPALERGARLVVELPGGPVLNRRVTAYDQADDDGPVLLFNAAGVLEIALRRGRASDRLGVARGDRVRVRLDA